MSAMNRDASVGDNQPDTSPICYMSRTDVKNNLAIFVNINWCKGCGYCITFCPAQVLTKSDNPNIKGHRYPIVAYPDKCTTCHRCEYLCPDLAIYLVEQDAPPGPILPISARQMKLESQSEEDESITE